MTRWTNETRRIPEPSLRSIGFIAGVITLQFLGEGSSFQAEMQGLPLCGFGSHLYYDYMLLAERRALAYMQENGWRLDRNNSSVAGIEMVVYRPDDPSVLPRHHATMPAVPHRRQTHSAPCFHCGAPSTQWGPGDNCPAFLTAMGFACDAPEA